MTRIAADVLKKLARISTATVANLIELFDVRSPRDGFMDARVTAYFPELGPMVGFASTATYRTCGQTRRHAAGPERSIEEEHVERFGELSGPAVVVIQDLDDPPHAAAFGDCGCAIYEAFGAAGLVTNGPGRDLEGVRRLDFPVFGHGSVCAHGIPRFLDLHVPVRIGGLTVYPDDLLHGDRDGIATIPREIAAELVDVADEWTAAEEEFRGSLLAGPASVRSLRDALDTLDAKVEAIRNQVSRMR